MRFVRITLYDLLISLHFINVIIIERTFSTILSRNFPHFAGYLSSFTPNWHFPAVVSYRIAFVVERSAI